MNPGSTAYEDRMIDTAKRRSSNQAWVNQGVFVHHFYAAFICSHIEVCAQELCLFKSMELPEKSSTMSYAFRTLPLLDMSAMTEDHCIADQR